VGNKIGGEHTPRPGAGVAAGEDHSAQLAVWCLLALAALAAALLRGWRPVELGALRVRLAAGLSSCK